MNYSEMNEYMVKPEKFEGVIRATLIVKYIILAQFCYSCLSSYMYIRKVHLSIKYQMEEDDEFYFKTNSTVILS